MQLVAEHGNVKQSFDQLEFTVQNAVIMDSLIWIFFELFYIPNGYSENIHKCYIYVYFESNCSAMLTSLLTIFK